MSIPAHGSIPLAYSKVGDLTDDVFEFNEL